MLIRDKAEKANNLAIGGAVAGINRARSPDRNARLPGDNNHIIDACLRGFGWSCLNRLFRKLNSNISCIQHNAVRC